jgi:heme oxygenase (staphylobilin-producing)
MFVATNRLKVKKGHGHDLEGRFRQRGGVERETGFLGFEFWKLDKREADHEEYLVVTHWESKEAHTRWTQSDSFRRAHSGPPADYILGHGEFSAYDVVFSSRPQVSAGG